MKLLLYAQFHALNFLKFNSLMNDPQQGINKPTMIKKIVFEELCALLDPKVDPYRPIKGKPNVLMMVGLQGEIKHPMSY